MNKLIYIILLVTSLAYSQIDVPRYIAYQGVLIDKNKQLKPDKTYTFVFKLYDSQIGGTQVWPTTPSVQTLQVANGIFSTLLGPFDNLNFDKPYYLDIIVDNEQFPQRILLYSSPYALGIANNSVSTEKIQKGAVLEDNIDDGAVTTKKIKDFNVTETKLDDISVSNRTVQADAIDSNKIKDKSISYNDLTTQSATNGNVLTFNNSTWQPQAPSGVPVGTIVAYGGRNIPTGWVKCDGTEIAATSSTFSDLYKAIDTSWGGRVVGGIQFFRLPDLKGRFLRGVDDGSGNDPDAASRTFSYDGGNTGNKVGSFQRDAFQGHWHNSVIYNWCPSCAPNNVGINGGSDPKTTYRNLPSVLVATDAIEALDTSGNPRGYGVPRVSSETRPHNAYVYYIIKY